MNTEITDSRIFDQFPVNSLWYIFNVVFFSKQDILENEDMKLDNMFMASLVGDIIRVSY